MFHAVIDRSKIYELLMCSYGVSRAGRLMLWPVTEKQSLPSPYPLVHVRVRISTTSTTRVAIHIDTICTYALGRKQHIYTDECTSARYRVRNRFERFNIFLVLRNVHDRRNGDDRHYWLNKENRVFLEKSIMYTSVSITTLDTEFGHGILPATFPKTRENPVNSQ